MTSDTISILHFTDTHLCADAELRLYGINTYNTFQDTVRRAIAECGVPDFVLVTGDISQDGSPDSYNHFLSIVSGLAVPVYYLPGNHDSPPVMLQQLSGSGLVRGERAFFRQAWQFILLNSCVEDCVEGCLNEHELAMLDERLELYPKHNTLVCLHHNPVTLDSPVFTEIGLNNSEDLFAVLDDYPQVKGILWGHVHQEYASEHDGVKLLATPSTCFQFPPKMSRFALDPLPPGYRSIKLHLDGTIESTVYRLDSLPEGFALPAGAE